MSCFISLSSEQATAYREGRLHEIWVPIQKRQLCDGKLVLSRHRDYIIVTPLREDVGAVWYPYGGAREEPLPQEKIEEACPFGRRGNMLSLGGNWAVPSRYDDVKPSELPHDRDLVATELDVRLSPEFVSLYRHVRHMPKWLREQMPHVKLKDVSLRQIQTIREKELRDWGIIQCPTTGSYSDCYGYWSGFGFGDKNKYVSNTSWKTVLKWYLSDKYPGAWEANKWCWRLVF